MDELTLNAEQEKALLSDAERLAAAEALLRECSDQLEHFAPEYFAGRRNDLLARVREMLER